MMRTWFRRLTGRPDTDDGGATTAKADAERREAALRRERDRLLRLREIRRGA